VTLVPTNTLELVEAAAAREAALAGHVEKRESPRKPLDVLVQHLVTVALGGGFEADPRPGGGGCGFTSDALFEEVKAAPAYAELTREEFDWAIDFVVQGGASLAAYPEFHRVVVADGRFSVTDRGIAQRHRLNVGTIVSDAAMQVKWLSGGMIGTIEEGFIARLNPGDCFVFAGRLLEYVRTRELTAYVKKPEKKRKGIVSVWNGSKMALSAELADHVLQKLQSASSGEFDGPEMQAAEPMLRTQMRLSTLPSPGTLLVERFRSREGHHLYVYPFAGRNVHVGLSNLLAWRLARQQPNSFEISVNDYGFELLSALPVDLGPLQDGSAFDTSRLMHDVLESLNSSALARKRFREIARVSGLIFSGYPGAPKSLRQLQASSTLFYEVFRKYDAGNLLLTQADQEVLSQELDIGRLARALQRMAAQRLDLIELKVPSPFSLPLMVERFREQVSTEKLSDRLERILRDAAKELGDDAAQTVPRRHADDGQAPPGASASSARPARGRRRAGR
jgi:ATP-dependent Lhr-like helicase